MKLCWMAKLRRVCFVHLGKFGDLMIMLPAFKAVADEMGIAPICMVAQEFASLFDGVSYVEPWVVKLNWWRDVAVARKMAEDAGLNPIVVKWWDEPGAKPPTTLEDGRTTMLTIHGTTRMVPLKEWDSFQASQWRYSGFTMQQMKEWPLVFDQRDPDREEDLRRQVFQTDKPKLLYNVSAYGTSPFRHGNMVMTMAQGMGWEMIDLSRIRATRIYDLLGLYDWADLLVTSDTATLHLAAASPVPYIAFINDGGAGSIPKGNCIRAIRYKDFRSSLGWFGTAIREAYIKTEKQMATA